MRAGSPSLLPPPHYSLLTTHYSLLTTHYSLLTTHYSLLTTHYSLLTTHYSLACLAQNNKGPSQCASSSSVASTASSQRRPSSRWTRAPVSLTPPISIRRSTSCALAGAPTCSWST